MTNKTSLLVSRAGGQAFEVGRGTLVDWQNGVTFQSNPSFGDNPSLDVLSFAVPSLAQLGAEG